MMKKRADDAIDRFATLWHSNHPDLDTDHLQTIGRILRLSLHLHDSVSAWLRPFGLSWETFDLLISLYRVSARDGLRPTELYEECLLSSGAMTNRFKMAEQLNLIERLPDSTDGRVSRVRLTRHGRKITQDAMAEHFARSREIANRLSQNEKEQLAQLLRKLLLTFEIDETSG